MLTHRPLYFIHTTHLYSSDSFTDRNSFPVTSLNNNSQPGPNTPYGHQIHHCEESPCCSCSSHSDWPSEVMVTLMWTNKPTPEGLPIQNSGIHWVNKLKSKPTGFCTAMTTLQTPSIPSQGMHQLSFTRKDRYPSLPSWSKTIHMYLPQQFYFFHFPSCFWAIHWTI